jgi:outer membrane receptor protein involved in Fe transport
VSTLNNTDVLPAIVLNVQLGNRSQLRASASQTLARPEYRELSPVQYLEVVGGQITRGNGDLVRTLIQNYDLKYEAFLASGELFSVGVFAKRFDRPIERIDLATGGQSFVSFFNAEEAFNFGFELEVRKALGSFTPVLEPYSVFSNLTLMKSDITVGSGASANTNANRAMMGQAPWVVNMGLSRTGAAGSSATVLYSAVGPRIFSAGTVPFPDVMEQPRHMVDLSIRIPLGDRWAWKMDARNLLDAPFRLTQGPVTRESFRTGRVLNIGVSWK